MILKGWFVSLSTKQIIAIPLNGYKSRFHMDISLSNKRNGTQIKPISIHGILWLQTHFESNHWESISNGQVIVPRQDAEMLGGDAQNAGLNINFINSLIQIDKI